VADESPRREGPDLNAESRFQDQLGGNLPLTVAATAGKSAPLRLANWKGMCMWDAESICGASRLARQAIFSTFLTISA